MTMLTEAWAKGALAGLAVAVAVLLAGFSGLAEVSGLGEVAALLAAAPVFAIGPLMSAPVAVQVALLVVWWVLVGAVAGWGIGRGRAGKAFAALFLVLLASGHYQTKLAIEEGLGAAAAAFGRIILELLK